MLGLGEHTIWERGGGALEGDGPARRKKKTFFLWPPFLFSQKASPQPPFLTPALAVPSGSRKWI